MRDRRAFSLVELLICLFGKVIELKKIFLAPNSKSYFQLTTLHGFDFSLCARNHSYKSDVP
jgi:hypothetical protein